MGSPAGGQAYPHPLTNAISPLSNGPTPAIAVKFFMTFLHRILVASLVLVLAPGVIPPAGILAGPGVALAASGLPLPRYVSLRASEVNVRTGPGVRYPVDWVFHRHGLPVEIVAEFDTWRKIRDAEGTEGWVHQSLLSGKRTLLVTGKTRSLYRKPSGDSRVLAAAERNVVGKLLACPRKSTWCQVGIGAFEGWMKRSAFWGVYPDEVIE